MDYPIEYLPCRSDGHSWTPRDLRIVEKYTLERHLWCGRHEGWRIDRVDRQTGAVIHRKYVTPKEYGTRGQGHVSRNTFRKMLVEREWRSATTEGVAS